MHYKICFDTSITAVMLKYNGQEYLFIHVPKTAGTSICKHFFDGKEIGHQRLVTYPRELWKKSFAVVRNPHTRLMSVYNYAKMDKSEWHSNDGSTVYCLHPLYEYCNEHTFKQFVIDLSENAFSKNQLVHLREQCWYVLTSAKQIETTIIRFESINEDMSALFGEDVNLPIVNKSNEESHHFDDEMIMLIKEIYKNDFHYFGPFDVPQDSGSNVSDIDIVS